MATPPLRMGTTMKARPPRGAGRDARPVVRIGRTPRPVPLLSGPVGPERLRSRYPWINSGADLALVDGCLEAIARLRAADAPSGPADGETRRLLAVAEAVRNHRADRNGAIAAFQTTEDVRDPAERADGVMLPDGLTWETLFTYGELARELERARDAKVQPADYIHTGGFREQEFLAQATRRFRADPVAGSRFNARSTPAMMDLLRRISRDPRIIDVRWAAYMLATAMWETNHTVSMPAPPPARGTRRVSQWGDPVEEAGKGRINAHETKDYYRKAKVEHLADGRAKVTEQDGDVFVVGTNGRIVSRSPLGASHGSFVGNPTTQSYVQATGTELAYFGRGYCQLTWWDNYASTGAEIGLGLELLLHPERALEPAIAYEVMAHGMVYGLGFANGQRLSMFFCGAYTDYVAARRMVNGSNHASEIAAIARIWEKCLMASKS